MISVFLGLSAANIILMIIAAALGTLASTRSGTVTTDYYAVHITMGIASGLMACLAHTVVYAYFMATTKWLGAATDKEGLDPRRFVEPARVHKHRVLATVMVAVAVVMLTLFSGAAADPTQNPWLPKGIHLLGAAAAVVVNLVVAVAQFRLVRQQGLIMDQALAILNDRSRG